MAYKTNKLTVSKIKAAKAKDKIYKLRDGGGLSLDVLVSGSKVWRYAYRFNGKQKTYTIGKYPTITLQEARARRDKARELISDGIDPSAQKQRRKKEIGENTFQEISERWLAQMKPEWSKSHYSRTRGYLIRDAYPVLGNREINKIEAPEVIPILNDVAARGAVDAAKRVKGFIQQVFDYALVYGKCSRNPVRDLNLSILLPKTIKKHYATITDPAEIGELLRNIDSYSGGIVVKSALQLSPYVMARPSEISNAEWSEIDFKTATWTIPAKRRKLPTHIKKANRPSDAHIIPLSHQALKILKNIHKYTGNRKHVFTGFRSKARSMSNNAVRIALRDIGYSNEKMTPHGFRAMASTLLNEKGYRTKVIEAQLAHKLKSDVERAYNHAEYIDERREMLNEWGNYLESLKNNCHSD